MHQSRIVAKRVELATEMMRTDTGFHADQARGHVGKPHFHLAARPLLTQHDRASIIQANNVERILTDIDADYGDRFCDVAAMVCSLSGAPLTSLSLAGQEHGRTIPLTDDFPTIRKRRGGLPRSAVMLWILLIVLCAIFPSRKLEKRQSTSAQIHATRMVDRD
jgi:hypothetical protein